MPDKIESFLGAYDEEVEKLALAARELVRRLVPMAEEKLHRPWKTISYGIGRKFCAISPHKQWVNLQFHDGAALEDPSSLLEGTGSSMRHVKLTTPKDLKSRALSGLIRGAAEHATRK